MRNFIVEILLLACLLPFLAFGMKQVVRVFFLDSFIIPTESMEPTLVPGDRVYVNKLLFGARIYTNFHFVTGGQVLHSFRVKGLRPLKHNDIVVFNMPNQQSAIKFTINYVFCKRCIGLPGDSVSIRNGFYKCNNFTGPLGYLQTQRELSKMPDSVIPPAAMRTLPFDDHMPGWTIKNFGPLYIPRKGDLVRVTPRVAALYNILLEYELGKPVTINWNTNKVFAGGTQLVRHRFKHNYYFMAGDYAINSLDSRYWGLVPEEYIVGIVEQKLTRHEGEINHD